MAASIVKETASLEYEGAHTCVFLCADRFLLQILDSLGKNVVSF